MTAFGEITGQNVSLTSPYNIGTASSPFLTNATSGLTVAATATSPSSAAIYVDNYSPLTSIGVSTYDGSATIQSDYNGGNYAGSLSFANNVLSETGNAVVTLTNTDNQRRLGRRRHYKRHSLRERHQCRHRCQRHCRRRTNPVGGKCDHRRGRGHGHPERGQRHRQLRELSIDITDLATLDATTTTGGIYIQNTSAASTSR